MNDTIHRNAEFAGHAAEEEKMHADQLAERIVREKPNLANGFGKYRCGARSAAGSMTPLSPTRSV